MNVNNNYTSNYNFKAVRISPEPEKWNQRVLNSVLKSNFVKNIITEDSKNERDTIMSFAEHYDPAYPDYTRYNHMFFNIKGNNKDVTLGSHSTYRFESAQFLKRAKTIKTGPENLGKDLSEQIEHLDPPEIRNKEQKSLTIEELRKLCKKIIIDKPKDYETFKD
jgi:hypothetical protein